MRSILSALVPFFRFLRATLALCYYDLWHEEYIKCIGAIFQVLQCFVFSSWQTKPVLRQASSRARARQWQCHVRCGRWSSARFHAIAASRFRESHTRVTAIFTTCNSTLPCLRGRAVHANALHPAVYKTLSCYSFTERRWAEKIRRSGQGTPTRFQNSTDSETQRQLRRKWTCGFGLVDLQVHDSATSFLVTFVTGG